MPLDNVIFPEPFQLSNRNPRGLPKPAQLAAITNFQAAVFESASRARNTLRPSVLLAGTILMRNVPSEYGKTGDQARTVPSNASKSTKVRWSGLIEGTAISMGALYTSLDAKGLLSEAMRYRRGTIVRSLPWVGSPSAKAKYTVFGPTSKDYAQLLVGRVYYTFKLKNDITVFDLTPSAASGFYKTIESDREYQAARRDLRIQPELWRIAFDPVDYTVSRPLGLSVLLGPIGHGLRVESAQNEIPEIAGSGANVVLGGADGRQINFLEPVGKLLAGTSEGHPALLEIKLDHGAMDHAAVMPGSVLPVSAE